MPYAILLCGPSLSGKSTAARRLALELDAVIVNADDINAERGLPFGAEGLPESVWAETLRIQLERMALSARGGRSVIADDTLCYRWLRDRHRGNAVQAGLTPVLLMLAVPEAELLRRHARLLENGERPVLGLERLRSHLASFEWPAADEQPMAVASEDKLARVIETLRASR